MLPPVTSVVGETALLAEAPRLSSGNYLMLRFVLMDYVLMAGDT